MRKMAHAHLVAHTALLAVLLLCTSSCQKAAHPQRPVDPPAGLVSWWKFEGDCADATGGNNGTTNGDASLLSYVAGEVGEALKLHGTSSSPIYIDVGNGANLQLQTFTIEAWIRRSSTSLLSQQPKPSNGHIFGFGQGGYMFGIIHETPMANKTPIGPPQYSLFIVWLNKLLKALGTRLPGYPTNSLYLSKVGIGDVDSMATITDTNWHHVAVTADQTSKTVTFYLDGKKYRASGPYAPGFTFSTGAAIGARSDDGSGNFYGCIDELSFYRVALTAAQIQSIYKAGQAGKRRN